VIGIGVGFLFRHGKPDKEIKEPELTLLGCRWFEANEFYKEKSQFKVQSFAFKLQCNQGTVFDLT